MAEDDVSRRSFFTRTLTAAGATLLVPVWLSGCEQVNTILGRETGDDDDDDEDDDDDDDDKNKDDKKKKKKKEKGDGETDEKSPEANDVEFLNIGAKMEQRAIWAYEAAAGLDFIAKNKDIMAVAGLFLGQHVAHRDAILKTIEKLGGEPVDPATADKPDIPADVLDEKAKVKARTLAVVKFARAAELDAQINYFKAATEILLTTDARRLAIDILPVEAQHVAVYDVLLKAEKVVNAPFSSEQV